ncbi:MAG TPA: DinB family protein [Vicinamibacteria bacterium]|nr:DinB family protein [Vicinamibacteria bacterium]
MFRTVADFQKAWEYEAESTLKLLRALTDASLSQAVAPNDRTLGRIAWHVVTTVPEMMARTGLTLSGPKHTAPMPAHAADMATAYDALTKSLAEQIRERWTDATLPEIDEMYGEKWKRGFTLAVLIRHQAHHRGQMTVLMRQAGLTVPGVYGPAREEWTAFGMAPPAI